MGMTLHIQKSADAFTTGSESNVTSGLLKYGFGELNVWAFKYGRSERWN